MPYSKKKKYGVIDIGSNSVRMVVYEEGATAIPLYNEKASCCLGKNLGKTGLLHAKGAEQAVRLLARFHYLAQAMEVSKLTAVATAAVRSAKNGQQFIRRVKREAKLKVSIIGGKEEALLSATGVVAAFPDASGIMGDMGGGSMELVGLKKGKLKKLTSLPLGPLSLMDAVGKNKKILASYLAKQFAPLKWLPGAGSGKTFYAVGGTFRAIARLYMDYANYPLHVVHYYEIPRAKLMPFLQDCIEGRMQARAERIDIAKHRIAALPYAAAVLRLLFLRARFSKICFSTYGLREGLNTMQQKKKKAGDLLISTCRMLALRSARFGTIGDEVFEFLGDLTKGLDKDQRQLFRAAAWISDIGWADHPEERAIQIFHRILHAPLLAVDHPGRCFLALCCFSRYNGDMEKLGRVTELLSAAQRQLAVKLGAGLRFADTLCGGAPHILPRAHLIKNGRAMILRLPRNYAIAGGEETSKRFKALAEAYRLTPVILQD